MHASQPLRNTYVDLCAHKFPCLAEIWSRCLDETAIMQYMRKTSRTQVNMQSAGRTKQGHSQYSKLEHYNVKPAVPQWQILGILLQFKDHSKLVTNV